MTLPEGWELGPDGLPRRIRKRIHQLSDLLVDEVSFVERGANQRAHIVLVKSDDQSKEPTMEVDPYGENYAIRYDIAKELTAILNADPSLYDRRYGVSKGDAEKVLAPELSSALGRHQAMVDQIRIAALADTTRSLHQRLTAPEVAASYDAVYGQPMDYAARAKS